MTSDILQAHQILLDGVSAYTILLLDAAVADEPRAWSVVQADAIAMLRPLSLLATSEVLDENAQRLCNLLLASTALVATSSSAPALEAARPCGVDELGEMIEQLEATCS